MQICPTKHAFRTEIAGLRQRGGRVGFVPTMGYLHAGHMALIQAARDACAHVVVSIFVNPTQFGAAADLDAYPRDLDRDLAMMRAAGVRTVFTPSVREMYPEASETIVETTALSGILMGALRPGHFRGVATVVAKLLNIADPDEAFFGEKDFQQLAVIRKMARDLDFAVKITGVPTVREADGLAMSSRNVRLTPAQRSNAVALSGALDWADGALATGHRTAADLGAGIAARLARTEGAETRSVDIRRACDLAEIDGEINEPAVILLAVRFGEVLLIDQRVVTP